MLSFIFLLVYWVNVHEMHFYLVQMRVVILLSHLFSPQGKKMWQQSQHIICCHIFVVYRTEKCDGKSTWLTQKEVFPKSVLYWVPSFHLRQISVPFYNTAHNRSSCTFRCKVHTRITKIWGFFPVKYRSQCLSSRLCELSLKFCVD